MIGLDDLRVFPNPNDSMITSSCLLASGWPDSIISISCSAAGAQECKIPHVTSKNLSSSGQALHVSSAFFYFSFLRSLQQWNIQNLPLPLIQYLPRRSRKKHFPRLAPAASSGCVLGAQQAYIWQKGKEREERERQQLVPPVLRWGWSVLHQKFLPAVNFLLKISEINLYFLFKSQKKKTCTGLIIHLYENGLSMII